MFKKFFITLILCLITLNVQAKEYVFSNEHMAVTLPDEYDVATESYVSPPLLAEFNINKDEAVQRMLPYGPKYKTLLYAHSGKESLELRIKYLPEPSGGIRDQRDDREQCSPAKIFPGMSEAYKELYYGAKLINVFNYENKDALYIVCDGENVHPTKGFKYYIAQFTTVKNGACYDFYVTYFSSNRAAVHKYLLKIIDSISYDVNN